MAYCFLHDIKSVRLDFTDKIELIWGNSELQLKNIDTPLLHQGLHYFLNDKLKSDFAPGFDYYFFLRAVGKDSSSYLK